MFWQLPRPFLPGTIKQAPGYPQTTMLSFFHWAWSHLRHWCWPPPTNSNGATEPGIPGPQPPTFQPPGCYRFPQSDQTCVFWTLGMFVPIWNLGPASTFPPQLCKALVLILRPQNEKEIGVGVGAGVSTNPTVQREQKEGTCFLTHPSWGHGQAKGKPEPGCPQPRAWVSHSPPRPHSLSDSGIHLAWVEHL